MHFEASWSIPKQIAESWATVKVGAIAERKCGAEAADLHCA